MQYGVDKINYRLPIALCQFADGRLFCRWARVSLKAMRLPGKTFAPTGTLLPSQGNLRPNREHSSQQGNSCLPKNLSPQPETSAPAGTSRLPGNPLFPRKPRARPKTVLIPQKLFLLPNTAWRQSPVSPLPGGAATRLRPSPTRSRLPSRAYRVRRRTGCRAAYGRAFRIRRPACRLWQ